MPRELSNHHKLNESITAWSLLSISFVATHDSVIDSSRVELKCALDHNATKD